MAACSAGCAFESMSMPEQMNGVLLLQSLAEVANAIDAPLTENRAAELLGVSVRTLQAWRLRGGGPRYCKMGRAVRYLRRELIAFQEDHTVSSAADTEVRGAA
jgi:hypothetical protein